MQPSIEMGTTSNNNKAADSAAFAPTQVKVTANAV